MRRLLLTALPILLSGCSLVGDRQMMPACEREIVELHRFFEDWFMGRLEDSDQAFARFEGVLAEGFTLVSPEGKVTGRADLLRSLRQAYGSYKADGGSISIRVTNIRKRQVSGDHFLVTYEEWQDQGSGERGRISSVLLRRRRGTRNGVEWLHVHETWMD